MRCSLVVRICLGQLYQNNLFGWLSVHHNLYQWKTVCGSCLPERMKQSLGHLTTLCHTCSLFFLSSCWFWTHLQSSLGLDLLYFFPHLGVAHYLEHETSGQRDQCNPWLLKYTVGLPCILLFLSSQAVDSMRSFLGSAMTEPVSIALYPLLLRAVATKCEKSKQSTLPSPQWSESSGAQIMLSYQKPRQVANRKGIDFS